MAKKKTAYVIIGDDPDDLFDWVFRPSAFEETKKEGYDVQFIRPKTGESFEDAVKMIEPGAPVYMSVHQYSDGTFLWNKGERIDSNREQIPSIVVMVSGDKPISEVDKHDARYKNSVETPFEVRSNADVVPGVITYEDDQAMDQALAGWYQKHPGKNFGNMSEQEICDAMDQALLASATQLVKEGKGARSDYEILRLADEGRVARASEVHEIEPPLRTPGNPVGGHIRAKNTLE